MQIRVSAIILKEGALLLLPHLYEKGILWHLPGGKIEDRETLEEALVRELFEELKIHVQVKSLSFVCMECQENQLDYTLHMTFLATQILEDQFPLELKDTSASAIQFTSINQLSGKILYPNIGDEIFRYFQSDPEYQICHYLGLRSRRSWL
jgi:ADP-ribose pyrophosphatase YjhB (NUDIX family)